MKKILLFVVFLFVVGVHAQPWTENFDTGLAGSYTTGTQTLSTGDWYTISVFQEYSSSSRGGTGHAARLNDDTPNASLRTPALNTIGTVTFYYREYSSGGGTFILEKSYNGTDWTTITTQSFSGTTFTEFAYDVNDNASPVYIRVNNNNNPGHLIIDDFSVTAYSSGFVNNPLNFTASAGGTDNIDLSWAKNSNDNNVMIAVSSDGTFGTPSNGSSYTVGSTISGGGMVIYNNNGTWYNHSGLNSNTTYYYKAWSVDGSNNYSSGVTSNATTTKEEPTNQVTGFTATAVSSSQIDLSWTENDGAVVPDRYLIKASLADNIADPTDGTEESDDTDFSDGSGAVNVDHGTLSFSWTGLVANTTYYFKIYPYTNSGSHIDYKTDGTVPSANATTQEQTPEYLIISEVLDPGDNYNARFVEIYNVGSTDIDLTSGQWYLSKQANGSATSWADIQLTGTISSGEVIVIGYSQSSFNTAYGFDPDYTSGNINGNGDDGYFLYKGGDHSSGTLVDAYGVINEDGTGTAWEYTDSRAYRKSTVTQANPTWTADEWVIESADVADATPGNYPEITDEKTISSTGDYDFTLSRCAFKMTVASIIGSDNFSVKYYKGRGPKHAGGISESNVSKFGWYFVMGGGITTISANLKFYISQLPENSVPEGANDIKLYKRETFGSGDFNLVGTLLYFNNGTPGNQSDDWLEYDGVTGFSEYVLASSTSALPVELTSFAAIVSDNAVKLSWTTATEVNSYGFEIQRSANSGQRSEFVEIGFVEGAGNSNSPKEYSFVDNSVSNEKYTYRLKQIDLDGSYKYSKEIEVTVGAPTKFELAQNYPNPFNPTTTISYAIPNVETQFATANSSLQTVTLKVYDALGREVATLVNGKQTAGEYSVKFDASKLTSGIYFYTLRAGNFVQTRRMILMK